MKHDSLEEQQIGANSSQTHYVIDCNFNFYDIFFLYAEGILCQNNLI